MTPPAAPPLRSPTGSEAPGARIRVLVVDDSPTMRRILTRVLTNSPGMEVVGEAADPFEAREKIKALSPDVVTLDVEMPRMDGLSFLDKIMRLRPMPVVMVSSQTRKGADAAIEAMAMGAVDCIGKPETGLLDEEMLRLPDAIRAAARARIRPRAAPEAAAAAAAPVRFGDKVILIGSSTGGVEALGALVGRLPANCPPCLIVQHMPESYTASFAAHLDKISAATVAVAADREPLRPGRVLVAPGGARHLSLDTRAGFRCRLEEGPKVNGHSPSVDVLFSSAAGAADRVVAAILTGMGNDGAAGLAELRRGGARTFGQSRESCVVYGMPRAAKEAGAVETELSPAGIAEGILKLCAVRGDTP